MSCGVQLCGVDPQFVRTDHPDFAGEMVSFCYSLTELNVQTLRCPQSDPVIRERILRATPKDIS